MTNISKSNSIVALRIRIAGCVQGLGVRPAVARLATSLELRGAVRNTLAGLEIDVEGTTVQIAMFKQQLASSLPMGSAVELITSVGRSPSHHTEFIIEQDDATGPLTTQIPRDVVVCDQCSAEVGASDDRRYLYPLTTCAACGPRYSLIQSMPFDRVRTTMDLFSMCDECRAEYTSPTDRRYHAQTIGCAKCGPGVWLVDAKGQRQWNGLDAVQAAARLLSDGRVVALRGVGGYQLLCDATNQPAVMRLRRRKARPAKPLAVLVASLDDARQLATIDEKEEKAVKDRSNPIVLLRSKRSKLASAIHPGLNKIGLMLPSTPLHAVLCKAVGKPLVCTSANREGEPLEHDVQAAEANLAGIADAWLHHDRPITRPIDDSVVQVIAERRVTIRLGRGLAPLPLDLPVASPTLAVGGHMKSAIAWHNGSQAALGPHVGDLDTLATRERFEQHVADTNALYRFEPESIVHDLHPDYFTTQHAAGSRLKRSGVQHHFAHVAAVMLEHELLEQKVLGVAWDGTGFGDDQTIWGGEFLLVDGGREYKRVAHLRSFLLVGGDVAMRQPWRVAVSLLGDSFEDDCWLDQAASIWSDQPVTAFFKATGGKRGAATSTSAGRLFDAVAGIILGVDIAQYEGQAAMMLEAVADHDSDQCYPLPFISGDLDWRGMIRAIWKDRLAGVTPAVMSMRFHRTLANGIVSVADEYPELPIVLCGGVFQNKLLTELVVEMVDDPKRIKFPGRIPPNDGGLAAGQLAIAVMHENNL